MTERTPREMLSLVDAAWLHMEMPTNLMMIGGVMTFDAPIDIERVMTVIQRRLITRARFRQRIVQPPVGPPWWAPDGTFDVHHHVHHVALPNPGGDDELRSLASDLMSQSLDMSRPLWDMHLVDNYRGGSAIITRLHHCIGDGTALTQVLLDLTDTTADAPVTRRPTHEPRSGRLPSLGGIAAALRPSALMREGVQAAAQAYTLARLTLLLPDPGSALKGTLGRQKRVAWTEPVSVEALRPLRHATGATVNDILVSAVTGALRNHIRGGERGRGHVPDRLRALVPVDIRADAKDGKMGNHFGLVFLDLPVGISDPMARLDEVHNRMEHARRSPEPSVAFEVLGALGLSPQQLQRFVVWFFGIKGTAVVTNVRGPAEPRYFAGQRIRTNVFFVPQSARLALGISIYSYAGEIRVGVISDAGLIGDPSSLTDRVIREVELLEQHALSPDEVLELRGHREPSVTGGARSRRPAKSRG